MAMPGFTLRSLVLTALLLLVATPGAATGASPDPTQTRFRRLDTEHGLSQAAAWTLAQDRSGLLWVGTLNGLNRFDGNEFRVYRHRAEAPDSLPDDRVLALALGPDDTLWVGGSSGLSRYERATDHFTAMPLVDSAEPQAEVRALHVDRHGTLWIGGADGLSRIGAGSTRREHIDAVDRDGSEALRIESLASDPQGGIWLGSIEGLYRFDPASGQLDRPYAGLADSAALHDARIDAIHVDSHGVLWIGAVGQGLFRLDTGRGELRVFRHDPADANSLNSNLIRSLLRDRAGRLWVGTREGLNLIAEPDGARPRVLRFRHHRPDPQSLGSGRVMSLLEAHDGSLLAGTYTGGISIYNERANRFARFTPDTAATAALRDPVIYSLLPSGPAALWLGGRNGLYRFDVASGVLQDFPATRDLGISAIAADPTRLWLGVLAGARWFDPATGRIDTPHFAQPWTGGQITRVWLDGERVFVGTFDRGIYVLRRKDLAVLAHYPIASWVSQIVLFDEDTVLVCASDGLHWLNRDGSQRRYHHRAGSEAGAPLRGGVTHFLRGANGALWLATAGSGLWLMQLEDEADPASARFRAVDAVHTADMDVVQALAEDARGLLWLSSSAGIARFDPARQVLTRFGEADGAFDSDYQSAAVAALPNGLLAFAATRGFSVFDPEAIGATPPPPAPLLTELRLWNRRIEPGAADARALLPTQLHLLSHLQLRAEDARMLSLGFSSLQLTAPERLRYAYRLDGFDDSWIEVPATERRATYTNLPPGRYVFRVKAGEAGRLEQAVETRLPLEILPPWWLTWWARSLAAIAVIATLYAGLRWRVRTIETQRRKLQQKVLQRTEELSRAKQHAEDALVELKEAQRGLVEAEKMASLGQLVAGVAHEINTPIGVALTASSALRERSAAMLQQVESGALKRSELTAFLTAMHEGSALVEHNLDRAAELVSSFKQVSVDRSADERREFELAGYLRTLWKSLSPMYEQQRIAFDLACADGLMMLSYPGSLAQIVSNLVQNAVVHAFDEGASGRISLHARAIDHDRIELEFRDSGRGIDAATLPRIFDPFFTTRRGQGGSGLGLHIVYNLVTARLGGQIEVQSTLGQGTCFTLRIPRIALA